MSRELRERADIVSRELREILKPLSDELSRLKDYDSKDLYNTNKFREG